MVNGGLCKDGMGWRRNTLCFVDASAMGDGKGRMKTESVGIMVFWVLYDLVCTSRKPQKH
jgi:hypothetical protein